MVCCSPLLSFTVLDLSFLIVVLQIPPYTSKDVLKKRLIYALENCNTMDADVKLKDNELYNDLEDDLS
jgi:hypothetical protein